MDDLLQIALLGKPELALNGKPLADLKASKDQALLYFMVMRKQQFSRAFLAGLFWGDGTEERARANLRMAIARLRRVIGRHLIITRQTLAFDFSQTYVLDVEQFEAAVRSPEQSGRNAVNTSIELYRGSFLEDFQIPNAVAFEAWLRQERERLHLLALKGLQYLAEEAGQMHQFEAGKMYLRRILALEPWQESAHRQLMWILAQTGYRADALRQFEVCQTLLQEELGVAPEPATIDLYRKIKSGSFPAANAKRSREKHNLPVHLSQFVGRESDLQQITEAIASTECRLLTLVGPGGIGKTRLALAAASTQIEAMPDGVWFVSLAGVSAADAKEIEELIIAHIAEAINYTFSAQQPPKNLLLDFIGAQELLLVLDNFEQLIAGKSLLATLLHRTEGVNLLVTSRERLGVSGEWVFDVGGLPSPDTEDFITAQDYASVRLFVQHARRVQKSFDLERDIGYVVRICKLVGGFPLGLELAANLLRTISCQEIVAQLAHNLDILETTTDLFDQRHRSMRAILDSAWDRLSEREQLLLSNLSIFQSGFDVESASRVAGANVPLLEALIDKSWVEHSGDGRYQIHELSRQFGLEKLGLSTSQHQTVAKAHATYFAELLAASRGKLEAGFDQAVIEKLDFHAESIRAAWNWLLEYADIQTIAGFLDGWWPYYQRKGWFQEAVNILMRACDRSGIPNQIEARWRRWIGDAYMQMGYLPESRKHYRQTVRLAGYRIPSTKQGWYFMKEWQRLIQSLHRLWPKFFTGRSNQADELLEAAKAVRRMTHGYYQAASYQKTTASVYFYLNLVERAGALEEMAVAYHLLSLIPNQPLRNIFHKLARKTRQHIRDPLMKAYISTIMGTQKQGLGQLAAADQFFMDAIQSYETLGLPVYWEEAKLMLASSAYYQGEFRKSAYQSRLILTSAINRSEPVLQFPALLSLAANTLRLGKFEGRNALHYLERARAFPEKHLGAPEKLRFYGLLSVAHLYEKQWEQAEEAAATSMYFISQSSLTVPYSLDGFAAVAEVQLWLLHRSIQNQQAPRRQKRLLGTARRACQLLHKFARDYPVGKPRAWLYQGKLDWLLGNEARALEAWRKSLKHAERLDLRYDQACANLELGSRLRQEQSQSNEHLAKAVELFDSLEAHYELNQIREHL